MKVIITSKNPVKVEATKSAFMAVFVDDIEVEAIEVESDVADQPFSDEATLLGSKNRIKNAKSLAKADFYVSIESGVINRGGELGVFSWVLIESNDIFGKARTSEFYLPSKMKELLDQGLSLGQAGDLVFGGKDTNQKGGTISFLTKGLITREHVARETIKLALIPFISQEFYGKI